MKKISKYIFALAALAFAAAGCTKEVEEYQPGDPEEDGCYGVYFPSQDASGAHTYDPSAAKEITITVKRKATKGAITVPCEFTSNVDSVFKVEPIKFADGQDETEFKVTFEDIEIAKKSNFSITISDYKYASKYSSGATSFDASILCVEWVKFASGTASTYTGVFKSPKTVETELQYYEIGTTRYCKIVEGIPGTSYGTGESSDYFFTWNTKTNVIYVPAQKTDFVDPDDEVICYLGDVAAFYSTYYGEDYWDGDDRYADWHDYALKSNNQPASYDGNGLFILADSFFCDPYSSFAGSAWQVGCKGDLSKCDYFLADGFTRTDYSVKSLEADFSSSDKLPVYAELGVDVESLSIAVYEGELTKKQVSDAAAVISAGKETNAVEVTEFDQEEGSASKWAAAEITLPKTGTYTVVAVSFAGKEAKDNNSCVANFTASSDADSLAVDLTCGVGSAAKYPGVNTDTAIEVWAYGTDIVDAKMAVFSKADLVSDYDGCLKEVYSITVDPEDSTAVADHAALIEAINDGGWAGAATRLLPGTEYYLVVYANNGWTEDFFVSELGETTTGDPLPIYQNFTADDWYKDGAWASDDDIIGKTFNCYAVDTWGSLGMREYIGKVTIADSKLEDEGPDKYGSYDEYVTVHGLGGVYANEYQFSKYDYIDMDLYDGCLYSFAECTVDSTFTLKTYEAVGGNWYSNSSIAYLCGFVPVLDGYYAFVNYNNYAGYNFCGLEYIFKGYAYAAYIDYLLVDPAKDDNGLAPATASKIRREVESAIRANLPAAKKHAVNSIRERNKVTANTSIRMIKGAVCPVKSVEIAVAPCSRPAPAKKVMVKHTVIAKR